MLLMLDFVSRDALAKAATSGAIAAPVKDRALRSALGVAATGEAFARQFFPVGEGPNPAPLEAPFSYVVRYHHPADDVAAFIENYVATHPVTRPGCPASAASCATCRWTRFPRAVWVTTAAIWKRLTT